MVADRQAVDVGPEAGHLAGDLVAEDHRDRPGPRPVDDRQIGMTQTRRSHPDEDLALTRWIKFDGVDHRRLPDLLQDGGANVHGVKETAFDDRAAASAPLAAGGSPPV